jgi:hypothetical protein
MSENNYRIRYKKGDLEVEVQGDKAWVEAKFKELTTKEITIVGAKVPQIQGAKIEGKALPSSLVEFLKQKGSPKRHCDRVTIFGYWLFHKKGMRIFNRADIQKCYSSSRISESTNTAQIINDVQGTGYFRREEEKKDGGIAWTITPTGEAYVEQMK